MSEEATGSVLPPTAPPEWWPGGWHWPPPVYQPADVSQKEAWTAKIDREYEEYSDRGHRRQHVDLRLTEKLDDERVQSRIATAERRDERDAEALRARDADRAERDRLYDRQAKREEDRRQVDDELRRHYLEMQTLIVTDLMKPNASTHNLTLQVLSDGLADFRMNRGVAYDRVAEKAMNNEMAQLISDAVQVAMKESLATVPARSGLAAPVTSFQPTPEKSA